MNEPLWTESTLKMVFPLIRQDSKVLEVGAGGSTIWFSRMAHSVVSLENDEEWFHKVIRECVNQSIKNVSIQRKDIVKPEYMEFILSQPDEYFDFILIDGAFRRVEAFEKCLPKLKKTGLIMLDDSQNPSWYGVFMLKGVRLFKESSPDNSGKKATIFEKI